MKEENNSLDSAEPAKDSAKPAKDNAKPAKESAKAAKFKEIAGKRVNNTINEIRKLSKCSNTRIYEYSQRDVYNMFRSISKELHRTRTKYDEALENKEGNKNKFEF